MAEGYEAYHVPQQSRRDKLRVVVQNHHLDEPSTTSSTLQGCAGLLPLYDPSLLPSDLLTCAANNHHHPHHPLGGGAAAGGEASKANHHQHQQNPDCVVKEEGVNLMMGYHPYLIPQSSIQINPSSIQEINNHPYLYTSQNLRDFDQSFNGGGGGGGEVVVYKPEPLSLSLSSHHTQQQPTNLPLELNLQRYESAMVVTGGYVIPTTVCGGGGSSSTSNDVSRSPVPLGPFTGYASILKGSRFLKPAQQLLEEFCDVGREIYIENVAADSSLMDPCIDSFGRIDDSLSCGGDGGEHRGKKSRLISMLDEVFRRYKQYYQQMQAVVASFESVAGLSNAAPFANLALKAMSKHFRCLKNAITEQLQFTSKVHSHGSQGKDEAPQLGTSDRGIYGQRTGQCSGFVEHQPVWRPQRGLPERAVTVLRAWLFEHFLHPYPTDTDKLMLAKQTGLSRNQVSNWFINARVRLWKPMVEEIHMLETRQGQKTSHREERNANKSGDPSSSANPLASENPSTSSQRFHDTPSKRTRNELPDIPLASEDPMNLSYNHHLPSHPNVGVGVSTAAGSSAVSLTLGLHQNNGIGLSEPFPINAAQRFGLGLDATSDAYIMSGFEVQNRHFGRDVIGGQLLHDFVG